MLVLFYSEIWACSLIYSPPYKFNPDEYIFVGKVISHVVSNQIGQSNNIINKYYGFLVEIVDVIYLPEKSKKYFEVYPLSLGPACDEGPVSKKYIENFFPIGSEVRIVAKKTKIKFDKLNDSNIQLEVSPHNQFTLSLNYQRVPYLISTKGSIFNYKNTSRDSLLNMVNRLADSLKIEDSEQRNVLSYSVECQKDFELRKDLYRLYSSNDDKEKVKIIYRLKNFKYLGSFKLISIILEYVKNETIRNKLLMSLFAIRDRVEPIEWIIGR